MHYGCTWIVGQERIVEPAREVPIAGRSEVLVVGGGPAGVGAALAAARTGARTTLVEHYGFLGGMWTAGLLNPILDHHGKGRYGPRDGRAPARGGQAGRGAAGQF